MLLENFFVWLLGDLLEALEMTRDDPTDGQVSMELEPWEFPLPDESEEEKDQLEECSIMSNLEGSLSFQAANRELSSDFDGRQSSSRTSSNLKCKFLWDCKIAGKIRLFGWMACLDALPTNENLFKKKISVNDCCSVCCQDGESILHILKECSVARQVWTAAPMPKGNHEQMVKSVFEWFDGASKDLDAHSFALFMTLCWILWRNRNEHKYNGGNHLSAQEMVKAAIDNYTKFLDPTCGCKHKIPCSWIPPSHWYFKINFDGVVFMEDHAIGVGVIVRNTAGEFMAGMAKKIPADAPVLELAKALAAVEAVQFAVETGFCKVFIEGDNNIVVKALQKSEGEVDDYFSSAFRALCMDAKFKASKLIYCDFLLVRRTGNKAARSLACFARDVSELVTWKEEPPLFLMPFIMQDIPS